ncbi:uncharacterized protein LOC130187148 [Seriola aureovittata]|uniref:uncharacterized protein LOC130187148 n=1 Tax=Seriola aureovittata TaxID=2871759 RepID=UPI0024BE3D77|nr:uncharacterized protein LOC130187148 [Seriola aureovittata]XP_056260479.1 uncharacterized protein LOC130187148 [Seriola aureovittata]
MEGEYNREKIESSIPTLKKDFGIPGTWGNKWEVIKNNVLVCQPEKKRGKILKHLEDWYGAKRHLGWFPHDDCKENIKKTLQTRLTQLKKQLKEAERDHYTAGMFNKQKSKRRVEELEQDLMYVNLILVSHPLTTPKTHTPPSAPPCGGEELQMVIKHPDIPPPYNPPLNPTSGLVPSLPLQAPVVRFDGKLNIEIDEEGGSDVSPNNSTPTNYSFDEPNKKILLQSAEKAIKERERRFAFGQNQGHTKEDKRSPTILQTEPPVKTLTDFEQDMEQGIKRANSGQGSEIMGEWRDRWEIEKKREQWEVEKKREQWEVEKKREQWLIEKMREQCRLTSQGACGGKDDDLWLEGESKNYGDDEGDREGEEKILGNIRSVLVEGTGLRRSERLKERKDREEGFQQFKDLQKPLFGAATHNI